MQGPGVLHELLRPSDGGALRPREAIAVLSDAYADRSGVLGGRTGSVTAIQRFRSGLNLNVHFHILAIDGVYSQQDADGRSAVAPHPSADHGRGRGAGGEDRESG